MFKKIVLTLSLVAVLGLTGCSKGNTNSNVGSDSQTEVAQTVDYAAQLEDIHTAVKEAYGEEYIPSMEIDATVLADAYGITEDMYDFVIAEGPMMSVHVDTFIAIHPTQGNEQAVVDALNAYRDAQINDALQYPMNLSKIQASEVKEMGDYVFFLMLGVSDELFDTQEEEIAAFQQQNQIAVDAIETVLNK